MKKLLGSTLALAMLVPVGANAELLKNFKASGSLEVDAVSANNVTDFSTTKYDNISTVQTRLMVHTDWDLLDDVHSHITLTKNNRTYGTAPSENVNGVEGNVNLDESYIKIDKLFGALDATLGRQFYGEAGDLVIYFGPKMLYGLPITALDGGRLDWNGEKVGVTVLGAKLTGSAIGTNDSLNANLQGLDIHAKPTDNTSAAAYVYRKSTVNSGTNTNGVLANDELYVAGLKGKVTMGGAWLKAEFDKNFGQNRTAAPGNNPYSFTGNYTGWAAKINLGYKADVNNVGALTGWGEAGVGSGGTATNRAFTAIAGDYHPGGIYGRFGTGANAASTLGKNSNTAIDGNTLSDRVIVGAGVKVTPSALSKLTAGISAWNYRAQTVAGLPTATANNKFMGNEYDLDLSWAHSENVTLSAGVGSFQPGRVIIITNATATAGVSPATMMYGDVSVKF